MRVSNTVSTSKISTPPSISPEICSLYDSFNLSKEIARNAGFSTSGDIDAVLLVGPIDPATNLGFSLVECLIATFFARSAE